MPSARRLSPRTVPMASSATSIKNGRISWSAPSLRVLAMMDTCIAGHLECPESVPLIFADRLASIQEIRSVKITPRHRADYPEVHRPTTGGVRIGAEVVQPQKVLAIAHFPHRRREIPPPTDPACSPTPSCRWAGCPDCLERLREAAWPGSPGRARNGSHARTVDGGETRGEDEADDGDDVRYLRGTTFAQDAVRETGGTLRGQPKTRRRRPYGSSP